MLLLVALVNCCIHHFEPLEKMMNTPADDSVHADFPVIYYFGDLASILQLQLANHNRLLFFLQHHNNSSCYTAYLKHLTVEI